jgi:hypothetical protein
MIASFAALALAIAAGARWEDHRSSETGPPSVPPAALGATVVLGEPFALEADLCCDLIANARAGERLRLSCRGDAEQPSIDALAASGERSGEVHLDPSAAHAGDDRALCERARRAGAIVLSGGGYLDWYALLTPSNKRSGLCQAIVEARRSGALLVASGAAGAFLAERAVVDRVSLNRLRRNPRDTSAHAIANGIGLVPGTLDASGAPHGSFERLLDLSPRDPGDLLVFVDGNAAWIARESEHGASEARGAGSVFVVDLRDARQAARALRGARLSLLADGDRWIARERTVTSDARPMLAERGSAGDDRVESSVDALALRREIARAFGREQASSLALVDWARTLTLRADADTRFGFGVVSEEPACARLALDVEWTPLAGAR